MRGVDAPSIPIEKLPTSRSEERVALRVSVREVPATICINGRRSGRIWLSENFMM